MSDSTKKSEFVFRRLGDSFDQFSSDAASVVLSAWWILAALAAVIVARNVYRYANPAGRSSAGRDATVSGLVWGTIFSLLAYGAIHEAIVAVNSLAGSAPIANARLIASLAALGICGAGAFAILIVGARGAFRYVTAYRATLSHAPGASNPLALGLAWANGLLLGLFGVWCFISYYFVEAAQKPEGIATVTSGNAVKWYALTIGIYVLGSLFVAFMYVKDARSVRWYWAAPLALLRMAVYAILCLVFLLPSVQTWEETNKQSRVVILLDISPSVATVTDEIGSGPKRKPKTRMDHVIEFLSDDNVAFLKRLLEKNPVAVYAFGTRLDESPQLIEQGQPAWSKGDWEAFARYDFKPFLLRGLSDGGKEELKKSPEWNGSAPGTPDWASAWFKRKAEADLQKTLGITSPTDFEKLSKNLEQLDKRIDVARTIAAGTNVADSVTAAVNRESANMVQGIVVFSDGRSNLGSDVGYLELRERASREKIPVFTVAVGEDRQTAAIAITEVSAPESAPIDEAWKLIVEADGVNMANKEVEVFLDLWMPDHDMKTAPADHTLMEKLTFSPGDPPHGQAEFVIDPAKLPEKLTVESKDAAIKKRVLPEGKWNARVRIAKDAGEAFAEAEHVRERPNINVVRQKLRILLVTDAPGREFTFLRTLLVREVQDQRAALATYVQNDAGKGGHLTPEKDETVLRRFPTRLDLTNKDLGAEEKPYNLNEYDLIIAFDPDWSELTQPQSEALSRWVKEGGGGLILVAGPINTYQLARVEEGSGRLVKILEVLPVLPADIVAQRIKPIPKVPRRLKLYPERIIGSELLKLDDKVPNDPVAGWEPFFTDRDKYAPSADLKEELFPRRGFFSAYPVKEVKPGSAVLAEFIDQGDTGGPAPTPWIVTNNPSASYRTAFLASAELYRLRSFDPGNSTGKEYFERFWFKLMKYMAAKRNIKAPRGRVLVSKEGVSGAPLRVQARILNENAEPYTRDVGAKFRIVRQKAGSTRPEDAREFGPYSLAEKKSAAGVFDGYYTGQVQLDPKQFPPGDFVYRVAIDVPDSPGETLSGEFRVRASNPEMDNTRPDFAALLKMASDFDADYRKKLPDRVQTEFGNRLPKEAGMPRLAFKLTDRELLRLIPDCIRAEKSVLQNRGPTQDLWDTPVRLDATRAPILSGLAWLAGAAFLLLALRGLWSAVSHSVPDAGRITLTVLAIVAGLAAIVASGLAVIDSVPAYGIHWVLGSGLLILSLVAFRAETRPGLIMLGGVAVVAGGAAIGVAASDYTGAVIPIAIGLTVVVALLCVEWSARKLLRLA